MDTTDAPLPLLLPNACAGLDIVPVVVNRVAGERFAFVGAFVGEIELVLFGAFVCVEVFVALI